MQSNSPLDKMLQVILQNEAPEAIFQIAKAHYSTQVR